MREDRPSRRSKVEIDFGGAAASAAEMRGALEALATPLERVTRQTTLFAREQAEAQRQATELARTLGRTLPEQTSELERVFRRTFQAESGLKGILRSFVNDARRLLVGLLEEMLGLGRTTGGAAGGLVSVLAGVGLGGAGGGQTPPFFASAFPSSRGGLGGINLAQILSRLGINLRGIGGIPGGTVLGGGLGLALTGYAMGGVGGALLGAGGGALAGFAVAGPIGAIVGGIAGLLGGIFGGGRGEKKRLASEIANRGFAELQDLFARYQAFRIDYAEALARMNEIWAAMEARWREIGGSVGRQSIATQRPYFDQILRAMEEIERERQRRAGVLAGFPLPEFQAGGYVGGSIVAALHPGEFVLKRAAVEALGRTRLESVNRGEAAGGLDVAQGRVHVTIIAADARGFEEMLRRNEDSLVRVIRAAARDRGRAAPL